MPSRISIGTAHTQWCDQETGLTSSAVVAQTTAAQARCPRNRAVVASVSPAIAATAAAAGHHSPVSGVCSSRARTPRSDWFAVISTSPGRSEAKTISVQKRTESRGRARAERSTVPRKVRTATQAWRSQGFQVPRSPCPGRRS
ncbi:hypothetical protein GCM10010361_75020 [Streptomyces olivaceiscleroticus]|uniref:Uncharacterized protein n=1 Tax=Streptomyces olivaceiscleroticus TaxID=68245 RepID=A0ABP3LGT7_9ACTN